MKAITVEPRKAGSIDIRDLAEPEPGANQLLLDVQSVGVCGTDRDIILGFYGEAPEGSDYLVLGHESLSRVKEVGPGVSHFGKGDLVVPTVRRNCPENCFNCRSGESDMCQTGHYKEHGIKGIHGFASELSLTDSRFAVKLPEALSEVGVLLEPLTIVEKGVLQTFRMQEARMRWKPKNAIVLGSGAVGLLATALLKTKGLDVTTVARKPEDSPKARLAASTGATYVNVEEKPLSTMEDQYDIVFEATGAASVALEAQNLCRLNGVVSFVGIYDSKLATEDAGKVFTGLVLGNRVYFGSVNANITYFRQGVRDLMAIERKWKGFLGSMITNVVPFTRGLDAYQEGSDEDVKTVLRF